MTGRGADGGLLESGIQTQIVQLLKLKGFVVWELYKGSTRGGQAWVTKGLPDLPAFKPGQMVFLEVKRPHTGRLSPAQVERHHELRVCGIAVEVVCSPEEALRAVAR